MDIISLAIEAYERDGTHIAVVFSSKESRRAAVEEAKRNGYIDRHKQRNYSDTWELIAGDQCGNAGVVAVDVDSKLIWNSVKSLWFEDNIPIDYAVDFNKRVVRFSEHRQIIPVGYFSDVLAEHDAMKASVSNDSELEDFIRELSG